MARTPIEENRRVEFYDECDLDPVTGLAKPGGIGKRVLYLASKEEQDAVKERGIEAVMDILAADAETHDVVAEKVMEVVSEDPLEAIKETLDALDQDDSKEANDWKALRTESK